MQPALPYLYLAPIKGITDALFRNTFYQHFGGIDAAIAPFINPQRNALFDNSMLSDVLPENNTIKPVIPQLLHTFPTDFLVLATRLTDLGFTHINWNLGCPVPMVAKKKRGSGLLPFPAEILSLLDKIIPKITIQLSIKTRLGFSDRSELLHLLPLLNNFSLKEIIIHTRLGNQLYRGKTDPQGFSECLKISEHILTYNGDINTQVNFTLLAQQFPEVNRWMLGRGVLMNPFLAEEIKGFPEESEEERVVRLYNFHDDLYSRYKEKLSGPGHLLGRMKQLWIYLIAFFPGQEKNLKKLKKSRTTDQYIENVKRIFD